MFSKLCKAQCLQCRRVRTLGKEIQSQYRLLRKISVDSHNDWKTAHVEVLGKFSSVEHYILFLLS